MVTTQQSLATRQVSYVVLPYLVVGRWTRLGAIYHYQAKSENHHGISAASNFELLIPFSMREGAKHARKGSIVSEVERRLTVERSTLGARVQRYGAISETRAQF